MYCTILRAASNSLEHKSSLHDQKPTLSKVQRIMRSDSDSSLSQTATPPSSAKTTIPTQTAFKFAGRTPAASFPCWTW